MKRIATILQNLDRRIIYLFVAIALALPLITRSALRPAPMRTADSFYQVVEKLEQRDDQIVLIALDWGPSTVAENGAQTRILIEHLMRRRVPYALISITPYAAPFMENIPTETVKILQLEDPSQQFAYGKDWVNLGYQPNGAISIQGVAKSNDLHQTLQTDASGTPLSEIPAMKNIRTLNNIPVMIQFTGLVGTLNSWLQFLQRGDYRPAFLHGCTSITIPEAHIYLSSGQLAGLHEGLAGAAAYEWKLGEEYPGRTPGKALTQNTSLAIAQLLILGLIVVGNLGRVLSSLSKEDA